MQEIKFGETQYIGEGPKGLRDNGFFDGECWTVYPQNGQYFFEYVSGALSGEEKTVEISKDIYQFAIEKNPSYVEMCALIESRGQRL